jgi:hypothetical protein
MTQPTFRPYKRQYARPSSYLKRGRCQHYSALDDAGAAINPTSKHAVEWCATGAMSAAALPRRLLWSLIDALAFNDMTDIQNWNDHTNDDREVVSRFRRAETKLQRRGIVTWKK